MPLRRQFCLGCLVKLVIILYFILGTLPFDHTTATPAAHSPPLHELLPLNTASRVDVNSIFKLFIRIWFRKLQICFNTFMLQLFRDHS